MKDKENAWKDYIDMIVKSWTYDRMTATERENCMEALRRAHLKGGYYQRWEYLQDIYTAFLYGLGYTGCGWRETDPEAPKF